MRIVDPITGAPGKRITSIGEFNDVVGEAVRAIEPPSPVQQQLDLGEAVVARYAGLRYVDPDDIRSGLAHNPNVRTSLVAPPNEGILLTQGVPTYDERLAARRESGVHRELVGNSDAGPLRRAIDTERAERLADAVPRQFDTMAYVADLRKTVPVTRIELGGKFRVVPTDQPGGLRQSAIEDAIQGLRAGRGRKIKEPKQ